MKLHMMCVWGPALLSGTLTLQLGSAWTASVLWEWGRTRLNLRKAMSAIRTHTSWLIGSEAPTVEPLLLPFFPNRGKLPRLMSQLFSWMLPLFSVCIASESIQCPLGEGSNSTGPHQHVSSWWPSPEPYSTSASWETSSCYVCTGWCGSQYTSTF